MPSSHRAGTHPNPRTEDDPDDGSYRVSQPLLWAGVGDGNERHRNRPTVGIPIGRLEAVVTTALLIFPVGDVGEAKQHIEKERERE